MNFSYDGDELCGNNSGAQNTVGYSMPEILWDPVLYSVS